jgi:hypothetical protein
MSSPSDELKKGRKAKRSRPTNSLDATPRPPLTARDLDDLPGIRKPKQRASLAPPAPPPVQASAPTVSHELFDIEKAEVDHAREAAARKAAARASARPHPPRKSFKPGDLPPNGGTTAPSGDDSAQRLSTPLSWAAAKDPNAGRASSSDLADAIEDEISDEFLEPADDSAPLQLPALPSAEPLASAIPMGSVVASPPSTPPAKRWGTAGVVALAGVGLLAVGMFVGTRGSKESEHAATGADVPAETPYAPGEANSAMRVPLPPLELDIGVPLGSTSETKEEAPAVPPVAPSGVLPQRPPEPAKVEHPPFDNAAATAALSAASQAAWSCRKEGDPPGSAVVIVRYAPSGRVTSATIEPGPFAGTLTGGCVATIFRKALVPPFSGDYMTVKKTVTFK